MHRFEMYGKPCAIVLRVQMSRKVCLDILLPDEGINVLSDGGRLVDLHIPIDGTTLKKVEAGILDAEFKGF